MPNTSNSSRRTGRALAALFVLSLIMGAGPGVLLVNRSETILGLPLLYAWGLFWYAVQVLIAIAASATVWRDADNEDASSAGEQP